MLLATNSGERKVKLIAYFLIFIMLSFMCLTANAEKSGQQSILMVVSSYGQEQGDKLPGFEFDELAKAYLVFDANGFRIDIASPTGGTVEADKFDPEKSYNKLFLSNGEATSKLANTLATESIEPKEYDAVFIVGGKGAMFDLPKDKALQSVIAEIYENEGTVSAVCHGPAALTDVKLSNGDYLVSGKKINSFTNVEEKAFGKKWVPHFEFMLEDRLKERGASFESSPMMLTHVAADNRLITGQNPFSTTATAEAVVRALGKTPVKLDSHKDDATITLITRLLAGQMNAKQELADNTDKYQPELVAMYGYYRMMFSESDKDTNDAVALMEIGSHYMDNPKLTMAIAQGYQKLGKLDLAKTKLALLIKYHPEMDAAKQLLTKIESSAK